MGVNDSIRAISFIDIINDPVADDPAGVIIFTKPDRVPLAITACIWLSETTVKDAAGVSPLPPIKTEVVPVKKLPLIVMVL